MYFRSCASQVHHTLSPQGLPGVGPRRDVPGWVAFQRKLAREVADGDAGEVGVSRLHPYTASLLPCHRTTRGY
jgi:hypothetical protein